MEKSLKDYAQYYVGCRCLNIWFPEGHVMYDNDWKLEGYREPSPKPYLLGNTEDETWTDSIKPILKRLDDLTNDDLRDLIIEVSLYDLSDCEFEYGDKDDDTRWVNALSKGRVIDCFSLTGKISEVMLNSGEMRPYEDPEKVFHNLLKQGFDLFGLIDAGLAVDEKTLQNIKP